MRPGSAFFTGARASRDECLVKHLHESRAVVRVTVAFIQLDELLDLLAHRLFNDARFRRDHIAPLRTRIEERVFDRDGNLVGLRELAGIQLPSAGLVPFRLLLVRHAREHVVVDVASVVARFDDADGNSERSEVSSQRIREPFDRVLAHDVRRYAGTGEDSGNRADVDDAPLPGDDQRLERLDHHHRPVHVHLHANVELFEAHVGNRVDRPDTGIVHQSMETASRFRDRFHCSRYVRGPRDVQTQRLHVADGSQSLEILVLARRGVDEIALCGEPLGDLAADAAAGSGDEDSLDGLLFGRFGLRE